MLKISIVENETRRRVVLEGKLVAPWTDHLKSLCQRTPDDPDGRELILDVRGLTIISSEGEAVLRTLMLEGAKFRGSDIFMKQILKNLARRDTRADGKKKA